MSDASKRAENYKGLISHFWRIASNFWRGSSAKVSWTLAILLVAIVLMQLLVQYWLNL